MRVHPKKKTEYTQKEKKIGGLTRVVTLKDNECHERTPTIASKVLYGTRGVLAFAHKLSNVDAPTPARKGSTRSFRLEVAIFGN